MVFLFYPFVCFALWLRYRIKVIGLDRISKEEGILFLANHPAEIDPTILLRVLWKKFHPHPVALEFVFQVPFVRKIMLAIGAIAIPDFDLSNNSYKRTRMAEVYQEISSLLKKGENILIYPSGGLSRDGETVVGGASGVYNLLQEGIVTRIVLVRTRGLWGSIFSRALTGSSPDLATPFKQGLKILLKNLLFFAPRREVTIELQPAPADFPWKGSKLEQNRYLENWFNEGGPEPLKLVSYSFLREELPKVYEPAKEELVSIASVSPELKGRVTTEIASIANLPQEKVMPESDLARDLGLDSLDMAQLVLVLKEQFGAQVQQAELTTVASAIAFAAKIKKSAAPEEEEVVEKKSKWLSEKDRPPTEVPQGKTIPEAFLNVCNRMKKHFACADAISGEVTYSRLKLSVVLLASRISKMEGERIGIMLPASVAANALIFATMLAGKVPVMINWTLGEKNLRHVLDQTKLKRVISSWNFLNRLENVELDGFDNEFVLLEDIRRDFTFFSKVKAALYSKFSTPTLLRYFGSNKTKEGDTAVILFTSGTESVPKGVPLSHHNILSNQKSAYSFVELSHFDVLLGILPPFHSFGFTVTGLLPILTGFRSVYSPNPTDGRKIAHVIDTWGATIACAAPTFLKNIFRVAKKEQLKSLRLVVSGAEKTPLELFDKVRELNPNATLIEGYGITECSPILTINPPTAPPSGVGLPLPNVELAIVHPETHEELAPGSSGLILAYGPNIFSGYLDPNLPKPFIALRDKHWYSTGDLGFIDPRGYLNLSGRLKRFVKIGGEMISLTAVEEALNEAAKANNFPLDPERPSLAITSIEEPGQKATIHLFATFPFDKSLANEELRKQGMSNLIKISESHEVPIIPLLGTGKIDYRKLNHNIK